MTLTVNRMVYRGDATFAGTILSGRLFDETRTKNFLVRGDAGFWRVTGGSGGWGGFEQLPVVSVAHALLADAPDEIVLDLGQDVRLICQFREGRRTASFLTSPERSRVPIPFEAPELLCALTEAIRTGRE